MVKVCKRKDLGLSNMGCWWRGYNLRDGLRPVLAPRSTFMQSCIGANKKEEVKKWLGKYEEN